MKKILIFSTAYFPLIGGAEVAVQEITNRFGDFEFDLVCAKIKKSLPKREKISRVNVYRLGCGCFLDKYYLALCGHCFGIKLHKNNNYYAVWAVMASFGGFAAMFFKKKNPSVPFLLTLQEGDPLEYIKKRVGVFSGWFMQIFTRADYIQAISNFLADWAKKMGAKCPVEVVPNGVSLNKYELGIKNNELRNKLGIKDNEKVIITISRLVKKNGVIDLVRAMKYLPENVKLLVVGEGEEADNLSIEIKTLLLEKKVFLVGLVPPGEVVDYYSISDIFVRPSLSEGLGNVFLEAMAAGVPIIGTPVGGIVDFLINGETGLFCEAQNPQSVAEKIKLLLQNEALRQKLIVNGKKIVTEKYDWSKISVQMEEIFKKLTHEK